MLKESIWIYAFAVVYLSIHLFFQFRFSSLCNYENKHFFNMNQKKNKKIKHYNILFLWYFHFHASRYQEEYNEMKKGISSVKLCYYFNVSFFQFHQFFLMIIFGIKEKKIFGYVWKNFSLVIRRNLVLKLTFFRIKIKRGLKYL